MKTEGFVKSRVQFEIKALEFNSWLKLKGRFKSEVRFEPKVHSLELKLGANRFKYDQDSHQEQTHTIGSPVCTPNIFVSA